MDAIGVTAAGLSRRGGQLRHRAHARSRCRRSSGTPHRIVVNFDPDARRRQRGRALHRPAARRRHAGAHRGTRRRSRSRRVLQGARRRGVPGARSMAPRATSTGWPTARARSTTCARPKGRSRCCNFLLPAVQRISDRLERMAVANDVAGYIGVDRGMVLDTSGRRSSDRSEKAIARPEESAARTMNACC